MKTTWEEGMISSALADLRKTWGGGWELLGTNIREALLARKILAIIAAQVVDDYTHKQKAESLDRVILLAGTTMERDLS